MRNNISALSTRNLVFNYREQRNVHAAPPVLDKLSIDIIPGEFTGILGPNGSGKTTLLKVLLRYLEAAEGNVSVFQLPQEEYTQRELSRKLSLVPQKTGGGASLTVFEMIILGRLAHMQNRWSGFSDRDKQIVDHVIDVLDLERFRERRCHCLSGGEFQKVLLARALVQQSSILLLDEATANLDLRHATEIMDLVRGQTETGKTVVAVMHDLNLAARYCNRVFLMKNGSVRFSGPPSDIYRREIIQEIYEIDAFISTDDDGIPFVLPKSGIPIETGVTHMEVV